MPWEAGAAGIVDQIGNKADAMLSEFIARTEVNGEVQEPSLAVVFTRPGSGRCVT